MIKFNLDELLTLGVLVEMHRDMCVPGSGLQQKAQALLNKLEEHINKEQINEH